MHTPPFLRILKINKPSFNVVCKLLVVNDIYIKIVLFFSKSFWVQKSLIINVLTNCFKVVI